MDVEVEVEEREVLVDRSEDVEDEDSLEGLRVWVWKEDGGRSYCCCEEEKDGEVEGCLWRVEGGWL